MKRIFYGEFSNLLEEYQNPTTREDKLIKSKLDSIISLYDNCDVKEREFADEILLEFSRIVTLLKNQHRQELAELSEQKQYFDNKQESYMTSFIPLHRQEQNDTYKYDYEILNDFYDHFKRPGNDQLFYWQINDYEFKDEEQRKTLVNLTVWDYCNRIKTFAKKYLNEIFPDNMIPNVIHEEENEMFETYEPIVFIYNNLELILAKMKTTNEKGDTIKQRLNIRSALRKLNDFKQENESSYNLLSLNIESNTLNNKNVLNPDESIEEAYMHYLINDYKESKLSKYDVLKACSKIKKIWSMFYNAYKQKELPDVLCNLLDESEIFEDELVNVETYFNEINAYCGMMKAKNSTNYNLFSGYEKELERFVSFINYRRKN